ncbi:MAG TPA: TolC family protein [Terracidiphilus sp.]|jgi:outer membrane protein TolC|nr:TolC family protein [Terracidiphilus sp.]
MDHSCRLSWSRQRGALAQLTAGLALACAALGAVHAQNPSSAQNPFYGSVTVKPVTNEPLRLSLDDAIQMGLRNNLGLKEAQNAEHSIHAQRSQALQQFLPTVTLTGDSGYYQHNLVALGFGPSVVGKFASAFPGQSFNIPLITHDTLTEGQLHYDQILFSGPVIAGWKAAGAATRAQHFATQTARGDVVQNVAGAYLHCIAAQSEVDNARALEQADQLQWSHAHDAHVAGTAANLDELRARVQYQAQEQARIAAENQAEKDLILLKREIGVDPGQKVELTDHSPYSELAAQTPEEVRALAYRYRNDYQNLQNQVQEFKAVHAAYRSQRWPSLSFSGNYGVEDIGGIGSHGTFAAVGTLSVPVFREGRLRGDIDASQAQLDAVNAQLADLRVKIDQQVRSALLDVDASRRLVEVARSNVDLATRALSDETERVNAGVDNTLPLVTAQATVAAAQSNLIESLFQSSLTRLALARAAGVLELQYRDYLGR